MSNRVKALTKMATIYKDTIELYTINKFTRFEAACDLTMLLWSRDCTETVLRAKSIDT